MNFEVAGKKYVCAKMDVFKQNHIARKLAPVLLMMANLDVVGEATPTVGAYVHAMMASSGAIADHDMDYAVRSCLSVTARVQPGAAAPAPLLDAAGGLMFADIESAPELMEIVYRVLEAHRLTEVFRASPSASAKGPKTDQT